MGRNEAITNQQLLLDELSWLDGATFDRLMLLRQSDLPEVLDAMHCDDCMAQHGGECPEPEDNACQFKLSDWLEMPAKRKTPIGGAQG